MQPNPIGATPRRDRPVNADELLLLARRRGNYERDESSYYSHPISEIIWMALHGGHPNPEGWTEADLTDQAHIDGLEALDWLVASLDLTVPGNPFEAAYALLRELRGLRRGELPKRRPLSKTTRFMVYRRDGYQCVECGEFEIHELSVDHIMPVVAGGSNEPDNLRTLCRRCNSRKGAR